jgi:hypothetical protein
MPGPRRIVGARPEALFQPPPERQPLAARMRTRVRAGSIAVRASEEYGYVSRDVRRIALIGGSLVAVLVGFWAIVQATGTRFFQARRPPSGRPAAFRGTI